MTTTTMSETWQPKRLTKDQEAAEIAVFVEYNRNLPHDYADAVQAYADGCSVLYEDDFDAQVSRWQIVDAAGRGDGTGRWFPIVEE